MDASAASARIWTREAAALAGLGAYGLLLLVITGLALRLNAITDLNLIVLLLLASGAITLAATKTASHAPPGFGLLIVLGGALALRLMVLAEDPLFSDDVYRYVWDGMVQAADINPYRYVPADPQLAGLRDAVIFPNINRADYATTVYPPVAQLFFFLITRIGASVTVMRIALIGCEVVTLVILIDLLRSLQEPVTHAAAYAWHPLPVWEIANNGHVDALMTMLVMIGTWLVVRRRRIAAGVVMALGAMVKPYAVSAIAAFWRPWDWDWRLPLVISAVLVACYLPYLGAGEGVLGFLISGYLQEEGFDSGYGFWLVNAARACIGDIPGLLTLYLALGVATLSALALHIAFRPDDSPRRTTRDIAALLLAGLFFVSPNYPWYALVVVPFIPLGGGAPAWTLSIGSFLLYLDWGDRWLLWKGVISGTFLTALLATTARAPIIRYLQGVQLRPP